MHAIHKTHQPQAFLFFNWDSPHARLNSHYEAWVAHKSYNKTRKKHGKVFSCCKKYDTYNIGTIQFFWIFKKNYIKNRALFKEIKHKQTLSHTQKKDFTCTKCTIKPIKAKLLWKIIRCENLMFQKIMNMTTIFKLLLDKGLLAITERNAGCCSRIPTLAETNSSELDFEGT